MKLLIESFRNFLEEDVGGFSAEFQLFIPRLCDGDKCDIVKMDKTTPVRNLPGINKPRGGFWTSTASETETEGVWTSSWNKWLISDMPKWSSGKGVLLRPKTTNVFHIENSNDAEILYEQFPLENVKDRSSYAYGLYSGESRQIDFEAALKKYDGIHWGLKSGKYSSDWTFGRSGAWDAESTVWRDSSALEAVEVVSVFQKPAQVFYDDDDED